MFNTIFLLLALLTWPFLLVSAWFHTQPAPSSSPPPPPPRPPRPSAAQPAEGCPWIHNPNVNRPPVHIYWRDYVSKNAAWRDEPVPDPGYDGDTEGKTDHDSWARGRRRRRVRRYNEKGRTTAASSSSSSSTNKAKDEEPNAVANEATARAGRSSTPALTEGTTVNSDAHVERVTTDDKSETLSSAMGGVEDVRNDVPTTDLEESIWDEF